MNTMTFNPEETQKEIDEILDELLNGLTQAHQRYEDAVEKFCKHATKYEQSLNELKELLEEH